MTQFVIVDEVPENIKQDEYVIEMPNFMAEIEQESDKAPRNKLTAVSHLRSLAGVIGHNYDENFSPWSHIKANKFVGRKFETNEDLSKIVLEMFESQYPNIFPAYISVKIKKRPKGTSLIYFVGPEKFSQLFFNEGVDLRTAE